MKTYNSARAVLTVAGLLALGTFAPLAFGQAASQDQSNPPAAQGMRGHGDPFAGLNLTDDQKAQIKKIHMDARAKADSVMADSSLSDTDKQAKVKEIHHNAMMEANKVLTPDQRAQLEKKMKERQESKPPSNP
jgi:Spy/CpxP family protein refolding chaperone